MAKFGSELVGNMVAVGAVSSTSARLWMRTEVAGKHRVSITGPTGKAVSEVAVEVEAGNSTDNTLSFAYPDDFPGEPALTPATRYGYKIVREADGTPLGEGRFQTSPAKPADTPKKFSIALVSCHQPFNSDGEVSERSMRLLKVAPKILSAHDVKAIIHCGDQIYADAPADFSLLNPHYLSLKAMPGKESLLDCNAGEVRRLYQRRYRTFWAMNEVRHIYANYPSYPILDDHEIIDDWGSNPVHATPKYAAIGAGAREAYFDYQGSRVAARAAAVPASFHYEMTYGNVACFVLDIRSQRLAGKQLYSDEQHEELKAFMAKNADKRAIFIVSSVPVVHLPSWLASVGHSLLGDKVDFADHWCFRENQKDRDRLLKLLHDHQQAHPQQRIAILSGDVHIGCAFAIHWRGGNKPILYQFTSSAISNRMKRADAFASGLAPGLESEIECSNGPKARVNLLKHDKAPHNPFGGLNLGIIEVSDQGDHSTLRFKMFGYHAVEQDQPYEYFDSGEL